jgi:hypothetical protein
MSETMSTVRRLNRLRALSRLLDNALRIPGTQHRVGLDPLLGLLPGGGDAASLAISAYFLWESRKMGASKNLLWRMAGNVAVDALIGSIPLMGDVFDFGFKANARNLRMLERELGLQEVDGAAEQVEF